MKKIVLNIVLVFTMIFSVNADNNNDGKWNWGANETETKGYWMAMERLVKINKYEEATVPLVKLLESAPELNLALYINAIKVYEKRAMDEKNPAKKVQLEDSTLMLYEKRIQLFGDEANVLNREGRVAWSFLSTRPNTSEQLYDLYSRIYELNKTNTYPENMYNYLKAACFRYINEKISKEEVVSVFATCSSVLDSQLAELAGDASKANKIEKYKGKTMEVFSEKVKLECEDIQSLFEKQDAASVANAKAIVSLSVLNNCFLNSAFITSAEYLVSQGEATPALYNVLGNAYLKQNENNKAYNAFTNALKASTDSSKISKFNFELAQLEVKKGNKVSAREFALKALNVNEGVPNSELYSFIGDLYFGSANNCTTGNVVQDRSVYIAAYEMYQKAGNAEGADQAKAQFPSVEELFLINKKSGDKINTGCWVNEEVTLQTRN